MDHKKHDFTEAIELIKFIDRRFRFKHRTDDIMKMTSGLAIKYLSYNPPYCDIGRIMIVTYHLASALFDSSKISIQECRDVLKPQVLGSLWDIKLSIFRVMKFDIPSVYPRTSVSDLLLNRIHRFDESFEVSDPLEDQKSKDFTEDLEQGEELICKTNCSNIFSVKDRHDLVCKRVSMLASFSAMMEANVLLHSDHPNIVKLEGYKMDTEYLYLFMEQATCSLSYKMWMKLPVKLYMRQLLSAIDYLNSRNIIHCDIKPDNILWFDNETIKLSDFGLSRFINITHDGDVGSGRYTPFEVMVDIDRNLNISSDIWSAGCVFFEMVTGYPFSEKHTFKDVVKAAINTLGTPKDPEVLADARFRYNIDLDKKCQLGKHVHGYLDPHGCDLLHKMLDYDMTKRITAAEALRHPYFN